MKRLSVVLCAAGLAAALSLVACGGAGGAAGGNATASSAGSTSSGTITAFGSVFVNGHEFATGSAQVIDDDTGATSSGNAGLEVGMAVDVKAAGDSSSSAPVAAEIHVHPLARGIVDGSDSPGGTLTVMGQTVQVTASTLFSDHRACLTATTSPCMPIARQLDLTATTGSGSNAVPGNYVTVHGFLFSSGTPPGSANIVATLVSVGDAPATAVPVGYKAEGVVTSVRSDSITIGGLAIDLANATCRNAGGVTPCASAFSAGQTVSVFGAIAPALPAASFTAGVARLRSKLVVETVGASVELEGKVSSVTTSAFVLRGITVDASKLTGGLPAQGDFVRVLGTVAADGNSIVASSVKVLHAALSATYGFEGNVGASDVTGANNAYVLTLLGQSIAVDASTRLDDRTVADDSASAMANPFNINTFQTYLAASSLRHVVVRAQADASGNLSALSVTITKASIVSGIAGLVDATPAPVNGTTTPSTFSVHGLAVSADPAAIVKWANDRSSATATVAAGDLVLARGSFVSGTPGTLNVAAPTGPLMGAAANIVIDFGVPRGRDHDPF